jgi:hypothetical protein
MPSKTPPTMPEILDHQAAMALDNAKRSVASAISALQDAQRRLEEAGLEQVPHGFANAQDDMQKAVEEVSKLCMLNQLLRWTKEADAIR